MELISGLEKYRGDNCILVWDITRSSYIPSAIDAVTSFDRRSMFTLDSTNVPKPVVELGTSESTQSISWFRYNPKLFVCGVSTKYIRLYDMRDGSKHQESTNAKAVFNLCVDPDVEHRLASSAENYFALWDVRNFEKPVLTISEQKPIIKLCFSPVRSGHLAVLCKDASTINLFDIQSPAGSDEVEPAVVERNLQPFPSHSLMSFAWHPIYENRMLTISQNNQLLDYTIFDRITLNWSPTSEIVWTFGRKILQCVDSRDEFYLCLNDISVKMRKRACQGYGFKCNNRIVWAQRKHLDDFSHGRIIGRLKCGHTQLEVSEELGIAQSVISRLWHRFQDDGNVSRCYSTGLPRATMPNENRYLAVTAKRNRWSTASDLSLQLPVRQFQGRPCTDA
ncbi:GATOR complex protein MIOS [Trichonephila clavipes]|nr:GATOR complex protein MIOS [Trichonephila clavipes]